MIYPVKIKDERLTPELKRIRSGKTQAFYKPENRALQTRDADIVLEPPEQHIYAELIDGEWWWVNGCAECNGEPRGWMKYTECDEHDVCAHCGIHRKELKDTPWGRKGGWVCKPCDDKEHEIEKTAALAAMPDEYDEWDYYCMSEIQCPYCNNIIEDSGSYHEADDEEIECGCCDNIYTVSAEISINYTMKKK